MPRSKKKNLPPRYVLVIEDNPFHAELITEILDQHCGSVIIHVVDTFEAAAGFLEEHHYRLIISAGRMKGVPFLYHIDRFVELAQGTPLLVVTGSGDERMAAELTKRGVSEYVVKMPDTLETLPELFKYYLAQKPPALPSRRLRKYQRDEKKNGRVTLIREIQRLEKTIRAFQAQQKKSQLQKLLLQLEKFQTLLLKSSHSS